MRDEIIIRPSPQSVTYFGAKASKLAYKRVWPTGETGSEWLAALADNPNYAHGEEHPFWFAEREGMIELLPALLSHRHPEGDITVIFQDMEGGNDDLR